MSLKRHVVTKESSFEIIEKKQRAHKFIVREWLIMIMIMSTFSDVDKPSSTRVLATC